MKELQTGSADQLQLLAVVSGDETLERRLHAAFAERRLTGEWFDFSDGLAPLTRELDRLELKTEVQKSSARFEPSRSVLQCAEWLNKCCSHRSVYHDQGADDALLFIAGELGTGVGTVANIVRRRVASVDADIYLAIRDLRLEYIEREIELLDAEHSRLASLECDGNRPDASELLALQKTLQAVREGLARMRGRP